MGDEIRTAVYSRFAMFRRIFGVPPEGRQPKHSTPRPVQSKPSAAKGTRLDFTRSLRMASVAGPPGHSLFCFFRKIIDFWLDDIRYFRRLRFTEACDINSPKYPKAIHEWIPGFWRKDPRFKTSDFMSKSG